MKNPRRMLFKGAICLTLFLLVQPGYGADRRIGAYFSNNVVSLPVMGYPALFHAQFHPGLDGSVMFRLNHHQHHQLWATGNAGIYYHRFFQTGIRIHGSLDYRYQFSNQVSLDAGVMLGYLHSFTWYDIFEMNEDGVYEKISKLRGRPQALGGLNLGASAPVFASRDAGYRIHLQFRTYLQAPFAGEYIPVIPTNALMIGVSKSFNRKQQTHE